MTEDEYRKMLHGVWINMNTRCFNKKFTGYKYYGGRGIIVSQDWRTYKNFECDMLENYIFHKKHNKNTSIERINNDGNYEKNNCRWATRKEQALNRRNRYPNRKVLNPTTKFSYTHHTLLETIICGRIIHALLVMTEPSHEMLDIMEWFL